MIGNISNPRVSVKEIQIPNDNSGMVSSEQKTWGYNPLLWYNGIIINENYIDFFELNTTSFLPQLKVIFKDQTYLMGNQAFSLDNTIISLYMDSRTKDSGGSNTLRPIRMDFKIIDYGYVDSTKSFYIKGVPDVNGLYLQKIKSYSNKTSFDTLKEISTELKLGFNSNLSSTDDSMNWINPSMEYVYFINYITKNSYKDDQSFMVSFIDYYYNLNYINVEQQLSEDISNQRGAVQTGVVPKLEEEEKNISVKNLILTNNNQSGYNNLTIESYEILNSSTRKSLKNGYRTNLYYYDRTGNWEQQAGTFLKFSIETNTDGQGIIMKSVPSDDQNGGFFNQNEKNVYLSPLDIDNTHMHYNYAQLLNDYNNKEIDKLKIKLTLTIPNYNFYKYQKISVALFDKFFNTGNLNLNERLSGGWLITGINFTFTPDTGLKQELICVKRELSISN